MFSVNLESITFMKAKIFVYQGKLYIIAQKNVQALFRNKQKYVLNYATYMQDMLMRLMSKTDDLIVAKGMKFTGSGKLGLMDELVRKQRVTCNELKAYSLMLNRGRSQYFQNLNFLHISVALLYEAQFPKGIRLKSFQYEMRAIFTKSLVHETLFNTVVYGSNETHIIMYNLKA